MGDGSKSSSNADERDWRTQLTPNMRVTAIRQTFQELMKKVPDSERVKENLRAFAARFEYTMNVAAVSLEDYFEKTSIVLQHVIKNFQFTATHDSNVTGRPAEAAGSIGSTILDTLRMQIFDNIVETMKNYIPSSSADISVQLWTNAVQVENKIHLKAASKWDYLHKISAKMLMIEETFRNKVPSEDTVSDVFRLLLDL